MSRNLAGERFDLLQARDRFRVILVGAEQEQLGFGEDRGRGFDKSCRSFLMGSSASVI